MILFLIVAGIMVGILEYQKVMAATATLHIITVVHNNYGGTATVGSFNIHVKQNLTTDVAGSPAAGSSTPGTAYSLLIVGAPYAISEDAFSGYTSSIDCGSGNASGNITLSSGGNTCTITNNDIPHQPPALKAGSYLTGQTLSVWPSWSVLGSAVGISLPVDPINQLGKAGTCTASSSFFCTADSQCAQFAPTSTCTMHDPTTGWSTADRRFSFACATDSFAYRYIALSTTTANNYEVRTHFEEPFQQSIGSYISNWGPDFVDSFVSTSFFIIDSRSGICNNDQEIATINDGICGDGKINANQGEQCDPPGYKSYDTSQCPNGQVAIQVCDNNCHWTNATMPCSNLSKCGNGIVEAGEVCDDGKLNGKYNHCNSDCKGRNANYCGDGRITTSSEICDVAIQTPYNIGGSNPGVTCSNPGVSNCGSLSQLYQNLSNGSVWSLNRSHSCNWDCQSYGPYCGDRIKNGPEECDGNQACTLNGQQGTIVCDSACHIVYSASPTPNYDFDPLKNGLVGWWTFDTLDLDSTNVFIADRSGNGNKATLVGGAVVGGQGRIGQALSVTRTTGQYAQVDANPNLNFTSGMTISFWVNPSNFNSGWNNILQDNFWGNGPSNPGTGWYFNGRDNGDLVFFLDSTGIFSTTVTLTKNTWNYIAVTLDLTTGQIKIFKDNNLVETKNGVRMHNANANLYFGNGDFTGMIDDVRLYNRVLSDSEVGTLYRNLDSNPCTTQLVAPVSTSTPGSCGDGVVDPNEACDKGTANNGKPCVPTYNKACSYCSADCLNTISVAPTQYCGNGVIEGPEVCDTDSKTGTVYQSIASWTTDLGTMGSVGSHKGPASPRCEQEKMAPYTYKKGIKVCANNCMAIKLSTGEDKCILCGAATEANGVTIKGSIVNVLYPSTSTPLGTSGSSNNYLELFISSTPTGSQLNFYSSSVAGQAYGMPLGSYYHLFVPAPGAILETTTLAYINYNGICSEGDAHYRMRINDDNSMKHFIDFPVIFDDQDHPTKPWQYDLVLSPVINSTTYPARIRVVVSWTGNTYDFRAGFLTPSSLWEGQGGRYPVVNMGAYLGGGIAPPDAFIWFNDSTTTLAKTNVESFDVDVSKIAGMYPFYVRNVASTSIASAQTSANLKVEVYFPEKVISYDHTYFSRPTKTYYLNQAILSDNANASMWQVFNIAQLGASGLIPDNVMDVNTIRTGVRDFQYNATCLVNVPPGGICHFSTGPCDKEETCTGASVDCPSDSFLPATTVCRPSNTTAGVCDTPETCTGYTADCPPDTFAANKNENNGKSCDSGDLCAPGVCTIGKCVGQPKVCIDSSDACDIQKCQPDTGACVPDTANRRNCNDNDPCTQNTCSNNPNFANNQGCYFPPVPDSPVTNCTVAGGNGTCKSGTCVLPCVPATCSALNCDTMSDNCGGTLICGGCGFNSTCSSNVCRCNAGYSNCSALNYQCVYVDDGNACTRDTVSGGRCDQFVHARLSGAQYRCAYQTSIGIGRARTYVASTCSGGLCEDVISHSGHAQSVWPMP